MIDPAQQMQSIDGFGYALTGGSAELLMKMTPGRPRQDPASRSSPPDGNNLGVSYLRVTIGASDLNSVVFSYDDLPAGRDRPRVEEVRPRPRTGRTCFRS